MNYTNTTVKEFIKDIIKFDNVEEILKKCKTQQ